MKRLTTTLFAILLFAILMCFLIINSALGQDLSKTFSKNPDYSATKPTPTEQVSKAYKDEDGNFITETIFKTKMKSDQYVISFEMQNDTGKYNVTYFLVPKTEFELQTGGPNSLASKLLGSKLPDCEFQTLDGKKITSKTLEGKVVVMNFWVIAGRQCVTEIPGLNELVQEYKNNPDVVFLSFALDNQEQLKKFLDNTKFEYSVIPETTIYNNILGIYAYPTQVVVNKNGVIKNVTVGGSAPETKKVLAESIKSALN